MFSFNNNNVVLFCRKKVYIFHPPGPSVHLSCVSCKCFRPKSTFPPPSVCLFSVSCVRPWSGFSVRMSVLCDMFQWSRLSFASSSAFSHVLLCWQLSNVIYWSCPGGKYNKRGIWQTLVHLVEFGTCNLNCSCHHSFTYLKVPMYTEGDPVEFEPEEWWVTHQPPRLLQELSDAHNCFHQYQLDWC